jgi:predicted ferric reductase
LGDYTRQLPNLLIGSRAEVEGAFGSLNYALTPNREQVWIAGGSGLAPFLGMARDLKNTSREYKVDLYCCVGSENELICNEELARIKPDKGWFRFIPFCKTECGRLDTDKIQKISGQIRHKEIFLCGPPAMVISLKAQFAKLRIPKEQIHSEEFKLL